MFAYDLIKIYGTQVPTWVLFYFSFFSLSDLFLHLNYSPIPSIITAYTIGTIISRVIHTYLADKAGVFSG